jgi:hypothetical protein
MAHAAMQRQRRLLGFAVLAGLGLAWAAGPASAQPAPFSEEPTQYRSNRPYQSEVEREERRREEAAGVRPYSPLSVSGGVDFRDHYFFRGYNYVSSGLSAQPYLVAGYTVHRDPNLVVTPHAGVWADFTEQENVNQVQERQTLAHVHEVRGDFGVAVAVNKFTFDLQYVYYTSPAEVFDDTQEVGADVRYDDRYCWRDQPLLSGLNPSLSIFRELQDDRDDDLNTFVGVGLEPALKTFEAGGVPITVSFPVTVGGSWDGYYKDADGHNATFGYWEAGVRAALPLGRSAFGMNWSVDAEVDYISLMARSARAANGFDRDDVVFRLGLAFR